MKTPSERLGLSIKGGVRSQPGNPNDPSDEGIFISKIHPGGVAEKNGCLVVGQRILEVNGQSLLGKSMGKAGLVS